MSLSCSAAAPCPKLPPNLTWTPRLSDSVDLLLENEDKTKYVSSVLNFTASHLHHGQEITCRALYTLQQGDIQKISEASLTLTVLCKRDDLTILLDLENQGIFNNNDLLLAFNMIIALYCIHTTPVKHRMNMARRTQLYSWV